MGGCCSGSWSWWTWGGLVSIGATKGEVKALETTWRFDGSSEVSDEVEGDALANGLKNVGTLGIEDVAAGA